MIEEMLRYFAIADSEWDFTAKKNLKDMCEDAWRWQNKNPDGYNN